MRAVVVTDGRGAAAGLDALVGGLAGVEVAGTAATPDAALPLVGAGADLVVADVALGHGVVDLVQRLMREAPVPVLVLAGADDARSRQLAVEALAAGAVEVAPRPAPGDAAALRRLEALVRVVSGVPVVRRKGTGAPTAPPPVDTAPRGRVVVGLAASTGGPPVLADLLRDLDGLPAPVLVVQHIHDDFVDGFAEWLVSATHREVRLAQGGEVPARGTVYLAPGGRHLRLTAAGRLSLSARPERLDRPSADELLCSLAEHAGANAVAAVLTGMGRDGARGLAAVGRAGGATFVQDEGTSAVFGMPKAALEEDPSARALPPAAIAHEIRAAVARRAR